MSTKQALAVVAVAAIALSNSTTEAAGLKIGPKIKVASKNLFKGRRDFLDEDEEQLTVHGGVEGGRDGLKWKLGFEHKFDEEQEQKMDLEKEGRFWTKVHLNAINGQKAAQRALIAKDIGLFDEWTVEAGVSGGSGGISGHIGISHTWDEEEQQHHIPSFYAKKAIFDEEEELQCGMMLSLLEQGVATFDELPTTLQDTLAWRTPIEKGDRICRQARCGPGSPVHCWDRKNQSRSKSCHRLHRYKKVQEQDYPL